RPGRRLADGRQRRLQPRHRRGDDPAADECPGPAGADAPSRPVPELSRRCRGANGRHRHPGAGWLNMTTANIVPVSELGAAHFIGIGGSGMSGIARIMVMNGVTVSGSDAKESSVVEVLRTLGATVTIGHSADNLGEADTLVISSAI